MTQAKAKKTPQHHRLTAKQLKADYQDGFLTSKGYLYYLIRSMRSEGWRLHIPNISVFCEQWGIKERTFYKAKTSLIKDGLLKEKIHGSIDLYPLGGNDNSTQEDEPTTTEELHTETAQSCASSAQSCSETAKLCSPTAQSCSGSAQSCSSTPPKPPESNSPGRSTTNRQLINISLTGGEREKFLEFAREKGSSLPNPPTLVERWAANNFDDLYAEFKRVRGSDIIQHSTDWRSHPRFDEWLAMVRKNPGWFVVSDDSGGDKQERVAFRDWVDQEGLV